MGASVSKETSSIETRMSKIRRSSKNRKSTTTDQVEFNSQIINNLKSEIDIFAGNRQSPRYSEFHEILTTVSKDLQQIKNKSSKQQIRDRCDQTLGEIQNCFQRLETKVNFNQAGDFDLDFAAVKSHSFINQQRPPPPALFNQQWAEELPQPTKQTKSDSNKTLDRLEQETTNLEKEIRTCIELEDFKQFKILEKKIVILYTDLEMITTESHTPLSEKKEIISRKLIKCNNQIKKTRKIVTAAKSKVTQKNELIKMDYKLEEIEIQALTFEGSKGEKKYEEMVQLLENCNIFLNSMEPTNEDEKYKKESTLERIRNIRRELQNRAEENEKQTAIIRNLYKIEQEIQHYKKEVDEFRGTSSDDKYLQLDQSLRVLWAELAKVEEPNEHVRRNKARHINEIQYVLKNLSTNTNREENNLRTQDNSCTQVDNTEKEIIQEQLLKQVREFQNHWEQLNYNLDVEKIHNCTISKSITDVLTKIVDGIKNKTDEIQKSTDNLIAPKSLDNAQHDPLQKSSPLIKPIETDIKVQPSVKTIGEMQRVGTEVKILLQQIRQSNCCKDESEFKIFKSKLEQCKLALETIQYNKKSDTIENNRRRVAKLIGEGFRALERKNDVKQEKVAAIRSSRAQELMDIDAEIQYFRQQIKNFTGVIKDKQYEKIKSGLNECLTKLEIIDEIDMNKQESIQHIQQHHQELETKLAENQAKLRMMEQDSESKKKISQDIKNVVEQVQKLKSQVERFSGVYDGLQFEQLKDNLNDCIQKLESIDSKGDERLQNAKMQTTQKIRKYLRLLDEKSIKVQVTPQSQPTVLQLQEAQRKFDSPHQKINSLRDKLVEIKDTIETFDGKYRDKKYTSIEIDALNCLEELKAINDDGHKSVVISKEQYEDYIQKLMKYFESKVKISGDEGDEWQQNSTFKILDPMEELDEMEKQLFTFKDSVDSFNGIPQDAIYNELKMLSIKYTDELDKVQTGNVVHVRDRKRKLIEEMKQYAKILEEKANRCLFEREKQMIKIKEIVEKVQLTSNEIDNFVGIKNDKNYCYLDESLITLMIQLDNVSIFDDNEIKEAKKNAIQLIQRSMSNLSKRVLQADRTNASLSSVTV